MTVHWTLCFDNNGELTLLEGDKPLQVRDLQLTLTTQGAQARVRVLEQGEGQPVAVYREVFISNVERALVNFSFEGPRDLLGKET